MSSQDEKTVERVAEALAREFGMERTGHECYGAGYWDAIARAALAAVPEQGGEDLRERERMLDSTRTCAECGDVEGFHVWPLDGSNSRAFRRNQCETFRPAASPAKGEGDAASTPPTGERHVLDGLRRLLDGTELHDGLDNDVDNAVRALWLQFEAFHRAAAVQGEEDGSAGEGFAALVASLCPGQRVMLAVVDEDFYPFDHDGINGTCVSGEGNFWESLGLDAAAAFIAQCRSRESEPPDEDEPEAADHSNQNKEGR